MEDNFESLEKILKLGIPVETQLLLEELRQDLCLTTGTPEEAYTIIIASTLSWFHRANELIRDKKGVIAYFDTVNQEVRVLEPDILSDVYGKRELPED